jgi:DNA-binding response OmpR family regulator
MTVEKQQARVEAERATGIGRAWQVGPRVLVMAEDPDLGDWLLEEFQNSGCAVALATRGRDGLGLLRTGLVDLVVSEMALPDLPGMDLLHEVRSMKRSPKVILTTAHPSEFLASRAIASGASAVLYKPFGMEQLLAAAARALGN